MANCGELCAKGKMIKISDFLTGFYIKITQKSYKKKKMQILRLYSRPKKLDFLGPGSENLCFYCDSRVILVVVCQIGKLWFK